MEAHLCLYWNGSKIKPLTGNCFGKEFTDPDDNRNDFASELKTYLRAKNINLQAT